MTAGGGRTVEEQREQTALRDTERWFLRRGLPQFVEGYSSERDIWTRAQPFLIFILALELIPVALAGFFSTSGWRPAAAVILIVGVLVGFGYWSKRRRGYWFAPADRVRWPFIGFFILAPVVASVVTYDLQLATDLPVELQVATEESSSWTDVVDTLVFQLIVLGIAYAFARYAVIAMARWSLRQTVQHFGDIYAVTTKALPLLLIVMIVLFINTEMWQVAGGLPASILWLGVGMLLILALLVTLDRTRDQIGTLTFAAPRDDVVEACEDTPMAGMIGDADLGNEPPLTRRQRGNLVVSAMMTQVIQAAMIGVVVWAFFMVFGLVAITIPVQEAWLGSLVTPQVVWSFGDEHGITRQLFRVSTFIGGFAAFYTTIYAATDDTYRRSFATDAGADLQRAINVRRAYLAVRRPGGGESARQQADA